MATRNLMIHCWQERARRHGPRGDTVRGANAVATRYASDAASFAPGGETNLEVLQKEASGNLAFWTGFQYATVHFAGRGRPVQMRIRVTEVFRREKGQWEVIHRHADVPRAELEK
jgi:ketosteroid isomerase-like protein